MQWALSRRSNILHHLKGLFICYANLYRNIHHWGATQYTDCLPSPSLNSLQNPNFCLLLCYNSYNLCVYVVYAHVCVWVHLPFYAHMEARYCHLESFFIALHLLRRQGFLLNLQLVILTRLVSHGAFRIYLFLTSTPSSRVTDMCNNVWLFQKVFT